MKVSKQYIAGLFDGEGYVSFKKIKGKNYRKYRIVIVNQYKGILDVLKLKYGGYIYKNANKKECWNWEMYKKETIKNFFKEIYPYLIIKKDKVKHLLIFLNG